MSDFEVKVSVLGFHPKYGELVSASAAKEVIAHFQEELAKANERACKAEKEVERLRSLFHKWKQEKDDAVWENHIVFENLLSEMQVCPKSEDGLSDKAWWKKFVQQAICEFAIEQKIESLEELHTFFLKEFDWKFPDDTHVKFTDVGVAVNARIAQLRKEQGSE